MYTKQVTLFDSSAQDDIVLNTENVLTALAL